MDNNNNSITLILSFFNQYLFDTAKKNIENLKYYYNTNIATSCNPLVEELLDAIDTYSFDSIGEPLFRSILNKCKKTPIEINQIMGDIIKWKNYGKDEIAPANKYLNDVISAAILQKANKLYDDSPSEFLKYLKNVNVPTGDIEIFSTTSFDKIDINSIIADSGNSAVPTNVNLINRTFPQVGGIERGQLGIITAPPGTGKTIFSMNLALYMASIGEKVLYVSCADMNWKDFVIRMGTIAFGLSFIDSYNNLKNVYNNLTKMVGNNLEISINPAGTVSADDIVEKATSGNYSVVFIDYDGVLKGVSEGDSMYNTFGDVYNTLTKLSISGKLVFICSQPKIYAYNNIIQLSDIGESSRKQQVVDFIIAISNPNPDCPNHLYVISFPKARRGKVGSKGYFIRVEGKFIEIPKGLYEQLKLVTEEKNYTEADIQGMINKFNSTYKDITNSVQQKVDNNYRMLHTPFSVNVNGLD